MACGGGNSQTDASASDENSDTFNSGEDTPSDNNNGETAESNPKDTAFKKVDVNIDVTTLSGIHFQHLNGRFAYYHGNMGHGAAVGDYDNDGDLDIYVLRHLNEENILYRNNLESGNKNFTNVTPDILKDTGASRTAQFVDLNNDNHLDLILINDHDGRESTRSHNKIFQGDGQGNFTDVTPESFIYKSYINTGCSLNDFDKDGLIDIYIPSWILVDVSNPPQATYNRLFRNLGNFQFEEVRLSPEIDNLSESNYTSLFTDFNQDTFADIFVARDFDDDKFYLNNQDNTFSEMSESVNLTHAGNDMGATAADFDDDGDLDIYATNIYLEPGKGNTLHINQLSEGEDSFTFIDEAGSFNVENTDWGWGTDFIDYDNDGHLDLVVVNGWNVVEQNVLFKNNGNSFEKFDLGDKKTNSRALIVFDYDRDGDEDLLITNMDEPLQLLENQDDNDNHWLHLILKPHNKAIGAYVTVKNGITTMRRDIIVGKSYLAGTPIEVHFGLGTDTLAEELTIYWNDGTKQVFNNVSANQILTYEAP